MYAVYNSDCVRLCRLMLIVDEICRTLRLGCRFFYIIQYNSTEFFDMIRQRSWRFFDRILHRRFSPQVYKIQQHSTHGTCRMMLNVVKICLKRLVNYNSPVFFYKFRQHSKAFDTFRVSNVVEFCRHGAKIADEECGRKIFSFFIESYQKIL